jgi:SAM-dependent methyltransferase
LKNVEWLLGDGTSLGGVDDDSADACLSFVVFQHIPDPEVTLGYIREVGRILRPGGWAVLHVSNDPAVHRTGGCLAALRTLIGNGPRGMTRPEWLGSAVTFERVGQAAGEGGTKVEGVNGEGSQYCFVLLRKPLGALDG